jgi:hypothetical protein
MSARTLCFACSVRPRHRLNSSPDWSPESFPRTLSEFRYASTADEDQRFRFLVFGDFKGFETAEGEDKIKGTVGPGFVGRNCGPSIPRKVRYCRQLSGRLRANDPGWDTPWVGMNTSGIGRGILLGTVLLLPVTGSAVLDYHNVCTECTACSYLARCASTARVLALLASVFPVVLSWIYRPQI